MKSIEDITKDEILKAFAECTSDTQVIKYFERKKNGAGDRFLKKLKEKANLIDHKYKSKLTAEDYENNPKRCKNCGKLLNYDKRYNKFCNHNCAAEFNNKTRIRKNVKPKIKQYTLEDKINDWKNGKNFITGVANVPIFIKRYMFNKFNNRCQICGWSKTNQFNGKVPLQIHHIDGNCTNNLENNLQLLCPNCHSLTDTFGSLNKNSKRFYHKKLIKRDLI